MQGGIFETSSSLGPTEWKLGGNSFGAPGVIGTLDAQPFVFYSGGSERARFLSTGNFGIGTITPSASLDVVGTFKLTDGSEGLNFILTSDATGLASWQPGPGSTVTELDPVISQINPPPGAPTTGDRYLINTAPTGVWVGHANQIAEWDGVAWVYTIPVLDDVVFITNTLTTKRFNGSIWVAYAGTAILQNGNTLTTHVIVGSNNAFNLQLKTNNVIRAQFTSTTGVLNVAQNTFIGHISTVPTARLHVRGVGATSATYALKLENSAIASLLAIQNDGYIGAGTVTPSFPFHILTTVDSNEILMVQSSASQCGITIRGAQFPFLNFFSGASQIGQLVATPTTSFILRFTDSFHFQRFTGNTVAKVDNSNNWYFANPNPDTLTAAARVHIQGADATASNYALKVDDSASSLLYHVRNDKNVIINSTGFFNFGDPDTDTSWRFTRSGNDLVVERREAGVWVNKQTFSA
jgi:hypothetical protein